MIIFKIIWALWFLTEILLTILAKSKSPESRKLDRSSLQIMWVAITLSITAGVFLMVLTHFHISKSPVFAYTGLILLVCGMLVRLNAIRVLGKFFTVNVSIQTDHRLVQSGPYRFVRHPSYSGALMSFAGLGLSFNNWLSLLVIVIPIFLSIAYRIRVEERSLAQQFGPEYIEYQKHTKKLIPFIY